MKHSSSSEVASRRMRAVRRKDTRAEVTLRRALHLAGVRYRLHRRDLPGSPDLVFNLKRAVVFVHGCFWHRHPHCPRSSMPKANAAFWKAKFVGNMARDTANTHALRSAGWKVLTLWECEIERDATACASWVMDEAAKARASLQSRAHASSWLSADAPRHHRHIDPSARRPDLYQARQSNLPQLFHRILQ